MISVNTELYALERLATGDTCIHRLHPLIKLLTTAMFIATVISFDRYAVGRLIPYIFYPMLLMALSDTPYSMLFKRFLLALPFCLFVGISNIIFDRSAALTFGSLTISYGQISFVSIIFRTYLCVMSILILVSVTRLSELTDAMRRLMIPNIFIVMLEVTYRYIGILINEAHSRYIAYSLRSANRKGIKIKDMGSFIGQLLLLSFDRADRVYNAMKCRGHAINKSQKGAGLDGVGAKDIIYFVIVCVFCASLRFIDVNILFDAIFGRLL